MRRSSWSRVKKPPNGPAGHSLIVLLTLFRQINPYHVLSSILCIYTYERPVECILICLIMIFEVAWRVCTVIASHTMHWNIGESPLIFEATTIVQKEFRKRVTGVCASPRRLCCCSLYRSIKISAVWAYSSSELDVLNTSAVGSSLELFAIALAKKKIQIGSVTSHSMRREEDGRCGKITNFVFLSLSWRWSFQLK